MVRKLSVLLLVLGLCGVGFWVLGRKSEAPVAFVPMAQVSSTPTVAKSPSPLKDNSAVAGESAASAGVTVLKMAPSETLEQKRDAARISERFVRNRVNVAREFQPLLNRIKLSPKKAQKLIDLVAEIRTVSLMEALEREKEGGQPPALEFNDSVEQGRKLIYDDIRGLLGESDYEVFDAYNNTLGARRLTTDGLKTLQASANALDDVHFEQFVIAMNSELRKNGKEFMTEVEAREIIPKAYETAVSAVGSTLSPQDQAALQNAVAAYLNGTWRRR